MAACGFVSVVGNVYVNGVGYAGLAAVSFNGRSWNGFGRASLRLKNHECGYLGGIHFVYDDLRSRNVQIFVDPWLKSSRSVSPGCYAAENTPSSGNSLDKSSADESSSKRTIPGDSTLKLLSGSCYLPHPAKAKTGGEDAHFICAEEGAVGLADGVGGWAKYGIDAGAYARELMSNSVVAIQQELENLIDPVRVLEKAHANTKAQGSSTACIITLSNGNIHAVNLGDSGFIVVRNDSTIFQSPAQQRGFNFPYQLMNDIKGDLPSSGQVFTIPVAPGDVIVAGTDGLFDNLFNDEITVAVAQALRAELSPEVTAEKIVYLARKSAEDTKRQTPFSSACQNAGWLHYGGKLDDITVVVSYVMDSR